MNRVVGFDNQLIGDLIFQGVSAILLVAICIIVFRFIWIATKALRIYIKKNS